MPSQQTTLLATAMAVPLLPVWMPVPLLLLTPISSSPLPTTPPLTVTTMMTMVTMVYWAQRWSARGWARGWAWQWWGPTVSEAMAVAAMAAEVWARQWAWQWLGGGRRLAPVLALGTEAACTRATPCPCKRRARISLQCDIG